MIVGITITILTASILVGIIMTLLYVGMIPQTEQNYMRHIYNFTASLVDAKTCNELTMLLESEKIWIKKNGDYSGWASQQKEIIKTSLLPNKETYLLNEINIDLPYSHSLRGWDISALRSRIEKLCKMVKKDGQFCMCMGNKTESGSSNAASSGAGTTSEATSGATSGETSGTMMKSNRFSLNSGFASVE